MYHSNVRLKEIKERVMYRMNYPVAPGTKKLISSGRRRAIAVKEMKLIVSEEGLSLWVDRGGHGNWNLAEGAIARWK